MVVHKNNSLTLIIQVQLRSFLDRNKLFQDCLLGLHTAQFMNGHFSWHLRRASNFGPVKVYGGKLIVATQSTLWILSPRKVAYTHEVQEHPSSCNLLGIQIQL